MPGLAEIGCETLGRGLELALPQEGSRIANRG
jgi:hypothetical protein